jgi:hypothetical protein
MPKKTPLRGSRNGVMIPSLYAAGEVSGQQPLPVFDIHF